MSMVLKTLKAKYEVQKVDTFLEKTQTFLVLSSNLTHLSVLNFIIYFFWLYIYLTKVRVFVKGFTFYSLTSKCINKQEHQRRSQPRGNAWLFTAELMA